MSRKLKKNYPVIYYVDTSKSSRGGHCKHMEMDTDSQLYCPDVQSLLPDVIFIKSKHLDLLHLSMPYVVRS